MVADNETMPREPSQESIRLKESGPQKPSDLFTNDRVEDLIGILLELDARRRTLGKRDFGPRVADRQEALNLLTRIQKAALEITGAVEPGPEPDIELIDRLGRLPAQCFRLFLFLLPICGLLFLLVWWSGGDVFVRVFLWMVILMILAAPLAVFRRARLNIEHQCGYVRTEAGRGVMVMERLPRVQFMSFLAHEYGHHLFFEMYGEDRETWFREGWARLFQWRVCQSLAKDEADPAFLHHVLNQAIGELKYALETISGIMGRRLPFKVRLIKTMYHRNPFYRLVTGTPGFDAESLMDHAMGTAVFMSAN